MIGAISVFGASLFGVMVLLSFKAWETGREQRVLNGMRTVLDEGACALKFQIERLESVLASLPTLLSFGAFKVLALVAEKFARIARGASEAAHRLADFISHKHNFERREIRSEFLKTMIEHKNGLAQPIVNAVKKRRARKIAESVQFQAEETEREVQP